MTAHPSAPHRARRHPLLGRVLRHPATALAGAAAIAGIALLLVSARVLPLLGGIVATLVIGCTSP